MLVSGRMLAKYEQGLGFDPENRKRIKCYPVHLANSYASLETLLTLSLRSPLPEPSVNHSFLPFAGLK